MDRICKKIVDKSEELYFLGEPSKTTIEAVFPENIDDIWINTTELTFIYKSAGGVSHISATSSVNLTGELTPSGGMKYILIEAKEDCVEISEE